MTTLTAQSRRMERDAGGASQDRERRHGGRRLVLALLVVGALVCVAVVANYGPLRHYEDARERLDKAAAGVASLEKRTAELQAELGKLTESGHLEDLAREQLTYALPGEDLYVVTGSTVEAGEADSAEGAGEIAQATSVDNATAGYMSGQTSSADTAVAQEPGFLERVLLRIAGLF